MGNKNNNALWMFFSIMLFGIGFGCGATLERSNWTNEVVARGFAHKEGDKLVWRFLPIERDAGPK